MAPPLQPALRFVCLNSSATRDRSSREPEWQTNLGRRIETTDSPDLPISPRRSLFLAFNSSIANEIPLRRTASGLFHPPRRRDAMGSGGALRVAATRRVVVARAPGFARATDARLEHAAVAGISASPDHARGPLERAGAVTRDSHLGGAGASAASVHVLPSVGGVVAHA